MAKYTPMDLIKSLSGKVCSHSDTYFANRYGTKYTGKICNPYTGEPSADQVKPRTLFATARANVKALTDSEKSEYAAAFKSNKAGYKSLNGYIFAAEFAKAKAAYVTPEGGE